MTLQQQARLIVQRLDTDLDHLPAPDNKALCEEYIEEELRKAFRAGQAAALERKGIQRRLEIEQERVPLATIHHEDAPEIIAALDAALRRKER